MSRVVAYAEVPGFYAEVERSGDPGLRDRAVVVGGDPRKGGQVQAATPEARAAGVREGMPMLEALERCPQARAVRTDMRRYREVGARLLAVLRRSCDRLEESGLGAAYFEVPAAVSDPPAMARSLLRAVRDELGLRLRVGLGPAKLLARLAAEESDAAGIRWVRMEDLESFLHPLSLERLPGVGANTAAALETAGARTVGDLVRLGPGRLESLLGNRGLDLLALAEGRDRAPVRASRHSKSLSQESTLASPQLDLGALAEQLLPLAEALEKRLALEGLASRRVTLKVRYTDQQLTTRSRTLRAGLERAADLHAVAVDLLGRTQAGERPVRLLGLVLAQLSPSAREDRQLELFSPGR